MTITGLKAGTHKNHAIFRSNSYEYEDSKSKDHYIRINKIPLSLSFEGLMEYDEKDIRETPEVEIDAEFTVTGTDIWGNNIASYNFPHKVYCNNQELTLINNKYTYKFTKAGVYEFKAASEDNEKYTTNECFETVNITDSGARETSMTLTFRNDTGASEVYSSDRIHATATITPSELTNEVVMKVYYNGQLMESIQGTEYHNKDNMKKGDYRILAEYSGNKYNLQCRDEHYFSVKSDPTDFTDLNFTTTSNNSSNVVTEDVVNVTGCLKSTKSNTPLRNTEYRLIIKKNGSTVSSNTYRTDDNGNINNSYKFMEEGLYEIEVKYDGDNEYYSPSSKRKSITCSKKTINMTGYKTSLWTTNKQRIYLHDGNGNPMVNQYIIFYVNGIYYAKLTDSTGKAELQINLNPNNYSVLISFNDETEISNCNSQRNMNILPNSLYDSIVEAFTMTVEPPVKQTRHSKSLSSISFNNQSRGWSSLNPALISQDNGADYLICYNINGRTSNINRPDSIHFKNFQFDIPENAIISSVKARFKTTYWRVNGGGTPFKPDGNLVDAYFDPANCGIPSIPSSYNTGFTPFEDMWTESECRISCYGVDKQCSITPSMLNDSDFIFSIDFGQNRTDNVANFGLVYFELSVEYFKPDE